VIEQFGKPFGEQDIGALQEELATARQGCA